MIKLANPDNISIVGNGDKLFSYATVEDTVVKITGKYYRRDSTEIIRLRNEEGKLRFYRKDSPHIILTDTGLYIHKKNAILTEDGIYFDPGSPNIIKIDSKYYRTVYCCIIDNISYIKTDPRVASMYGNSQRYLLKTNSILLSSAFHKIGSYMPKGGNVVQTKSGHWTIKDYCQEVIDGDTAELVYYHQNEVDILKTGTLTALHEFQDKTNPQEDRLIYKKYLKTEANKFVNSQLLPGITEPIKIHIDRVPYFENIVSTLIMPRLQAKAAELKKSIDTNFSDLDDTENRAKVFKTVARPWPGKQSIYMPQNYGHVIGKTFKTTGGLQYSFGIEFETSQGLLTERCMEDVSLFAVGDRSIGAAEYVTPPMMGDAGIEKLKLMCKVLNAHTLVDDRCGLHVHVGTLFSPTKEGDLPKAVQSPSFSQGYLMNIINLSSYIEEELFSSLPKNRTPTLYHCHSIRRFAGINKTNFSAYLGAFIFGPKEVWVDDKNNLLPLFNFEDYKLNRNRNHNTNVGTWAEGRYKWLNLIHSFCNKQHKTTEFRIFSATTVFEKVYAYLMTSMALVYVADNKPSIIKVGVTLSQVFKAAYPKHLQLQAFLNTFYEERKIKFNRKDIYPNLPFLK